jgi:hypothetical protein
MTPNIPLILVAVAVALLALIVLLPFLAGFTIGALRVAVAAFKKSFKAGIATGNGQAWQRLKLKARGWWNEGQEKTQAQTEEWFEERRTTSR